MSVSTLVAKIQKKIPSGSGWGATEILSEIDAAQRYVFTRPCKQTLYLSSSTGLPPYLPTTAGTFQYNVPNVSKTINSVAYSLRVYSVARVFVDVTVVAEYNLPYIGDIFELSIVNPFSTGIVTKKFARIPCNSLNATQTDTAKIIFESDPGTTTDAYYCESIMEPIAVTSTSIPLMISQKFEQALFDYVVGNIQDNVYGKDSRLNRFYDYWCPLIWEDMDAGTTSRKNCTPIMY